MCALQTTHLRMDHRAADNRRLTTDKYLEPYYKKLVPISKTPTTLLPRIKRNSFLNLFIISIFLFSEIISAQKAPNDFGIYFKFGFHKEDATHFDSRKKTLIVQGIDTLITIKLNLSAPEKQTIYEELIKINFINYPDKYIYQPSDTEEVFISSPCQHYFLTTTYNHISKYVEWDNCIQTKIKDEKHIALMNLDRIIEKIIWAKKPLKDYHPSRMGADPN
jgi:hypothetical protein